MYDYNSAIHVYINAILIGYIIGISLYLYGAHIIHLILSIFIDLSEGEPIKYTPEVNKIMIESYLLAGNREDRKKTIIAISENLNVTFNSVRSRLCKLGVYIKD